LIHGRITSSRGKDQHQKEQEFSASSTQYSSVDSLYGWRQRSWLVQAKVQLRNQRRNKYLKNDELKSAGTPHTDSSTSHSSTHSNHHSAAPRTSRRRY
jgi:hypothetical protein